LKTDLAYTNIADGGRKGIIYRRDREKSKSLKNGAEAF